MCANVAERAGAHQRRRAATLQSDPLFRRVQRSGSANGDAPAGATAIRERCALLQALATERPEQAKTPETPTADGHHGVPTTDAALPNRATNRGA